MLEPKKLELLHELVPKAAVVGVLVNPTYPTAETASQDLQAAAQRLARKSGSFFRSGPTKDTSTSGATTNSTPGTDSTDGTHISRFLSSLRNPSRKSSKGSLRRFLDADGLHPPRAIATPTRAAPTATIERPIAHGRNPA